MFNHEVFLATTDQELIGWKNLLYGRLSKQWSLAQEEWLKRSHSKYKLTLKWAIKSIKLIVNFTWSLWEHRNIELHSPDHRWKQQALALAQTTAKEIFHQITSTNLPPRYQYIANYSWKQIQTMPMDPLRQWTTTAQLIQNQLESDVPPPSDQSTLDRWLE